MASKRRLAVLLGAAALAFCGTAAPAENPDCYAACPRQVASSTLPVQLLSNPGFSIGYSSVHREPLWTAYRATALPRHDQPVYRHGRFAADPRLLDPVQPWDYRHSGYDRGHLAPAFLLTALFGPEANTASYWMSNVTPQTPRFNRLLWERLEEVEAHEMTRQAGTLWVLAGPIFGSPLQRTAQGVAIPAAFFRIWLRLDAATRQPRACAFIVPQTVRGNEPLSQFATSVDAVEASTGLDFYAALAASLQARLEQPLPDQSWSLAAIADWPARYGGEFNEAQ